MLDVRTDLTDDRFDLAYDPAKLDTGGILGAIRGLGYTPQVVERPSGRPAEVAERVDPIALGADLQAVFAEARRTGKPVLLDFTGPG
ncbi:MAG: hypothetical protein HY608_03935 [Planctomycetes bacterium]|nr:hypothetical protein [Planctomycetota bacterium]